MVAAESVFLPGRGVGTSEVEPMEGEVVERKVEEGMEEVAREVEAMLAVVEKEVED